MTNETAYEQTLYDVVRQIQAAHERVKGLDVMTAMSGFKAEAELAWLAGYAQRALDAAKAASR